MATIIDDLYNKYLLEVTPNLDLLRLSAKALARITFVRSKDPISTTAKDIDIKVR